MQYWFVDWENFYKGIKECNDMDELNRYPYNLLGGYYLTYYRCPFCNGLLYKIQARNVYTCFREYNSLELYNIFTCPNCFHFYASLINNSGNGKLSELALVSKKYNSKDEYVNTLLDSVTAAKVAGN